MKKWTVKVENNFEGTGNALVWCLNDDNSAIGIDVEKHLGDWVTKYRGQRKIGFSNKTQAVADAKKQLKKIIVERKGA
jgi:hypothetical protein